VHEVKACYLRGGPTSKTLLVEVNASKGSEMSKKRTIEEKLDAHIYIYIYIYIYKG